MLEVSGIRQGTDTDLARRHSEKLDQLKGSSLHETGYPGYVFAVLFGLRHARFSHHAYRGEPHVTP